MPAYRQILAESGVGPSEITTLDEFKARVPVIDKGMTFGRFGVAELCRGGEMGQVAAVLTSSGHSGHFAYGIYSHEDFEAASDHIDDALDAFFNVRSRPTLLINCLAMGVKVYTRACTLGETSVRADMVTALVSEFGRHYAQVILVGEAAFIKHALELGRRQGLDWGSMPVHIIVGEEPLAENARKYLEILLGAGRTMRDKRLIISSMGVAEIGLNFLFELPA